MKIFQKGHRPTKCDGMGYYACLFWGFVLCGAAFAAAQETSSFPLPTVSAVKTKAKITLDGKLDEQDWKSATPFKIETTLQGKKIEPVYSCEVRILWSDDSLYLAYVAPYEKLTILEPVQKNERIGLWEGDVVEVYIGADPDDISHYTEYEISPSNERLDLVLKSGKQDFAWDSKFESAISLDEENKIWTTEVRIPLSAISPTLPEEGTLWKVNFYRLNITPKVFAAWSPTLSGSAHVPQRFGTLKFKHSQ